MNINRKINNMKKSALIKLVEEIIENKIPSSIEDDVKVINNTFKNWNFDISVKESDIVEAMNDKKYHTIGEQQLTDFGNMNQFFVSGNAKVSICRYKSNSTGIETTFLLVKYLLRCDYGYKLKRKQFIQNFQCVNKKLETVDL